MNRFECGTKKPDQENAAVARYLHFTDLATTALNLHIHLTSAPPVEWRVTPSSVASNPTLVFIDQYPVDPYLTKWLSAHLKAEFADICWPHNREGWTGVDAKLLDILCLVSRRRTFLGTCDVCASWSGESDVPATVLQTRDVAEDFLKSKRVAEKSKESYRHTLNVFVKHCPVLPSAPEEIEQYLARVCERTGKPISERTAAGNHTVLKMLYDFAHDRLDFPNVMEKVDKPVFKEKEAYAFTREEAKAICAEAAKNETHLALIHLFLGHGWRAEEAVRLTVGDVGETEILVWGKKRSEYMPLLLETKELLAKLANGRKTGEPFFSAR